MYILEIIKVKLSMQNIGYNKKIHDVGINVKYWITINVVQIKVKGSFQILLTVVFL